MALRSGFYTWSLEWLLVGDEFGSKLQPGTLISNTRAKQRIWQADKSDWVYLVL